MPSSYWLYRWLDEQKIRDVADLERRLSHDGSVRRLIEAAGREATTVGGVDSERAILAGRGFDLSMTLECPSDQCRQAQVRGLFRRVWHYFGYIVLTDALGQTIRTGDFDMSDVTEVARSVGAALLFIRDIGGEDLVTFREKPDVRPEWEDDAHRVGLAHAIHDSETIVAALIKESTMTVETRADGTTSCQFVHPELSSDLITRYNSADIAKRTVSELHREIAESALWENASLLTSDAIAASDLHVPLACGVPFQSRLLRSTSSSETDVLINLELPVLDGVRVDELLRLRADERDSFERFRHALTVAINEKRKVSPATRADVLAREIERDLIAPRLAELSLRLKLAENTLAKKALFGISLGGLATTCGLLFAVAPLAVGGAIAAIGAAAAAEAKFLDEKREAQMDDLYFAWDATRHAD